MDTIVIILALCGGALLSVQAAINGRLGSQVGVLRSAFLTFATGATGGGDMSGPRAVLNLYLREVGYLPRGGPRRTVSCADASGIVNIA